MVQDEEKEAKRQYEEKMEKMLKADERMKQIKAEKDEMMRRQIEAKIKEEQVAKKRAEKTEASMDGGTTPRSCSTRDGKSKERTVRQGKGT